MILIITNKEDAHPTPVIERLSARDVPVFRLNTEALLTDYEFEWYADASHCDFWIRCKLNGLEIRERDITAVWDRRPEKPAELPVANTSQIDKHNLEEALGFLVFLRYYIKDIPSIGSIANDRPAAISHSAKRRVHYAENLLFESKNLRAATCPQVRATDSKTHRIQRHLG